MAKLGKRGWSSDFRASNFTADGIERFVDDRRDELYGRHDACGKPGKTIHEHKTFGETPREPPQDVQLQVALEAAQRGDAQSQYRAGMMLLKSGDKELGMYWLRAAADKRWPEAVEYLNKLEPSSPRRPIPVVPSQSSYKGRVKRFYIVPIITENGEKKYVLLLKMTDESSPVPMSRIQSTRGKIPTSDVFATHALAKEAGLRCLREWAKR